MILFPVAFLIILLLIGLISLFVPEDKTNCDWKGALQRRFVWRRLRHEWGRWCYRTDCLGETRASWWEHDLTVKD